MFREWFEKKTGYPGVRTVELQSNVTPGTPLSSSGDRKTMGQLAWELLKVFVASLAIVLPIRFFIFQPFSVQGQSMVPSFEHKDYLIIDEISYRFREPIRGEVVVFKYPYDKSQYYIKRLIGLPGERVVIKDNIVTVYSGEHADGLVLDEPYLKSDSMTLSFDNDLDKTLKEKEYFVLGDNRENSSDSRVFGPVHEDFIIGRVWLRGWPVNAWQLYDDPVEY